MRKRKKAGSTFTPGLLKDQQIAWEDARSFLERRHPLNPKRHSKRQRNAFNAFKSQVGWAGAILYNETTNTILDGHMRLEEAASKREKCPIIKGRWTKEQEKLILAQLDPIGFLGGTDKQAMASLVESTKKTIDSLKGADKRTKERLAQLTQDISENLVDVEEESPLLKKAKKRVRLKSSENDVDRSSSDDYDDPQDGKLTGNFEGTIYNEPEAKNDIIFPSDLPYGIPPLLLDRIATPDLLPIATWTRNSEIDCERTEQLYYCHSSAPFPPEKDGGVLGFFTEDWRFDETFRFADDFLGALTEEDWTAIVSPEFSTYYDWPLALRIYNVYRSRWCARYWQEAGFTIIPCVQDMGSKSGSGQNQDIVWNTLSGSTTIAFQVRTNNSGKPDWKRIIKWLTSSIEAIKPKGVLIYGGEHRKKFEGFLPERIGKTKIEYSILDSYLSLRTKRIPRNKRG